MVVGVETKEMGWDLSLRAQSRRAQMMTSVWLQEEDKGQGRGSNGERQHMMTNLRVNRGSNDNLDPVLGINLVGRGSQTWKENGNLCDNLKNNLMEHDLEEEVLIGEEGKKRNRREMEDALAKEETNTLAARLESYHGWFVETLTKFYIVSRKKGGLPREEGRMEAFRKALEECNLSDIGFNENWFTWERGNLPETSIQERLDRGGATEEWSAEREFTNVSNLKHGGYWEIHF
ncbi:hypothetical protein Goarm_023112 [Gossypium armourianum]|uniref:Uncharacterized protein n=1 Tax=Gossypium armourianum TaxID=34283 RepID=A0A7J9KI22_9ROSI|nr:hypothetical protein [Gossypium armourianum]